MYKITRNKTKRSIYLISFLLMFSTVSTAQQRLAIYDSYAARYNVIAIEKMQEHGIPASITLAQGILESGAGQSELATKANNHFGIKCYDGWTGASIRRDDDRKNECFKKYKSVEESYEDHSIFLKRSRYQNLYSLKVTDYKGWAKGLQKAGYATDKTYADKLIKIIEDYGLYQYDSGKAQKSVVANTDYTNNSTISSSSSSSSSNVATHKMFKSNGVLCVIANAGDSYEEIARMFGKKPKDIYKYNDAYEGLPLKKGSVVYLQKKKKKAQVPYFDCVVKSGDTVHKIAQKYGVQVEAIYKMNKFSGNHTIAVGDVVKLR